MAKILYAWELGADWGHIQPFLTLATYLSARGHEVVFAAKDLSRVHALPEMQRFVVVQAPVWLPPVKGLPEPQVCYADILQRYGYLDATGLLGMVSGWRALFDLINPNLLIADHSPTALLASRGLNFPAITYGSGFLSPPRTVPMPSMRPWLKLPARRIDDSEAAVLRTINQVLAELGEQPLQALADLFAVEDNILMTPAELDHYQQRGQARYMGPVSCTNTGATPEWPKGPGKNIFAYIKTSHPQSQHLLTQLLDSPFNVLAYVPGLSAEKCRAMRAPNVHFSPSPVDMRYVAQHAKAIICHAGFGTTQHGLLSGLPLLLLPGNLEQLLVAHNVATLGMGIFTDPDQGAPDFIALLRELVKNPRYGKNALGFARKYAHVKEADIMAAVVSRCEELMNIPPGQCHG